MIDHYRGDTDDEDDEQDRLYESISKGSLGRWQESTDDADTEDDDQEQLQQLYHRRHQQHHHCHHHCHHHHQAQDQNRTPAARNTDRVKRKKSARRNIKYVVKPVRRAPSAATRRPSVTAKSKTAGTPTASTFLIVVSDTVFVFLIRVFVRIKTHKTRMTVCCSPNGIRRHAGISHNIIYT